MGARKAGIELLRFLAAILVVLIHIRQMLAPDNGLAETAFITVDLFFMLTGFFTAREALSEARAGALPEARDAVRYVWRRAKGIFGLYLFAEMLMFVIRTAGRGAFDLPETLREFFHFKWEFLMLHMAGFNRAPAFNTDYLLAPAWFISSLLLALVPFFFLCHRYGRTFAGVIAPVCAGAFVFRLSEMMEEGAGRAFLRAADIPAWLAVLVLFVLLKDVIPGGNMVFWTIPFAVILLNGTHDTGPVSALVMAGRDVLSRPRRRSAGKAE